MANHNIMWQRNKPLNRVQKQILFKNVEANPHASDKINKNKQHKQFWEQLGRELNKVGPPIKSISEWRRAWRDQKRYMSRRATTHQRLNDDDSMLSSNENTFMNLFDLGIEDFNDQCLSAFNSIDSPAYSEISEEVPAFEPGIDLTNDDSIFSYHEQNMQQSAQNNAETQQEDITPQYSLESLNTQHKELLSNTNSIKNSLDRMLEEMQRHNLEMENLKKFELKFKMKKFRKMTEFQERKLQILKKEN